jgi:hypothetical protein
VPRPARRRLIAVVVVVVIAFAATLVLDLRGRGDLASDIPVFLGLVVFTFVGVVILWRRPGHGIGRLALLVALVFASSSLLRLGATPLERWGLAGILSDLGLALSGALAVVGIIVGSLPLLVRFPSGRITSPLGHVVDGLLVLVLVLGAFSVIQPMDPLADPFLPQNVTNAMYGLAASSIIAAYVLTLVDLLRRYRRADATVRVQIRWVVAAAGAIGVLLALISVLSEVYPGLWELAALVFLLPPIAIAFAITRYHLYDIDRIISRTLTYAALTVVLTGLFLLVNLTLQQVLQPLTGGQLIPTAVATLLVAASFNPVRLRLQAAIDRRFHRARYDAERITGELAGRLRGELDLQTLADDLRAAAADAVEPATIGVWLRRRAP